MILKVGESTVVKSQKISQFRLLHVELILIKQTIVKKVSCVKLVGTAGLITRQLGMPL